jgi:hypothetical protein
VHKEVHGTTVKTVDFLGGVYLVSGGQGCKRCFGIRVKIETDCKCHMNSNGKYKTLRVFHKKVFGSMRTE